MKNGKIAWIISAALAIGASAPAHADITGTIDATITLEAGCIVNGQNSAIGKSR